MRKLAWHDPVTFMNAIASYSLADFIFDWSKWKKR